MGGLIAVVALVGIAVQASAHPPHTADHGVNKSTACTLWAGDVDVTNASDYEPPENDSVPELCTLAPLTDIPHNDPPDAVERWNRGELGNVPDTGYERSAHPPNATLADGRFIEDAHATVFAVQPSTRAHISPSDQPLYVASNGTLLGAVDYRVDVPKGEDSYNRRVTWSVSEHRVNATRLVVDGRTDENGSGSGTLRLNYSLAAHPGSNHSLTLEADVFVELKKTIRTCGHRSHGGECLNWEVRTEYPTDELTVSDSVDIVEYDLTVSGYRGRYPNGDLRLVVYKNHPWLGYDVPGGEVNGVWRFYAARDTAWDDIVTTSESGESTDHSPAHPLQVHAYPIETGPTAEPVSTVAILDTYGTETTPSTLPEPVDLDILTEPYTASFGIATRTNTTTHDLGAVTAHGLVRGVDAPASERQFLDVPINETNLTVTVRNRSAETLTLRLSLRDNATGEGIDTSTRDGYLVVADRRVNTTSNGTTTVAVASGDGSVSARFVPGEWWDEMPGYVRSSDVTYAGGAALPFVGFLFQVGVPVSLFLLAVFMIDRVTGWRVWPPWGRQ